VAQIVMVEVKFFASLRERIALGSLASSASSLPELRRDLASQLSPEAYQVLCGDGVRVAINQVFTDDDWQHSTAAIPAGAEVAFLPPVTGG
jgi:molybdopterin synthase sulfur carrier subunit